MGLLGCPVFRVELLNVCNGKGGVELHGLFKVFDCFGGVLGEKLDLSAVVIDVRVGRVNLQRQVEIGKAQKRVLFGVFASARAATAINYNMYWVRSQRLRFSTFE